MACGGCAVGVRAERGSRCRGHVVVSRFLSSPPFFVTSTPPASKKPTTGTCIARSHIVTERRLGILLLMDFVCANPFCSQC